VNNPVSSGIPNSFFRAFFSARSGKLPLPYQNVLHEIQTAHHVAFRLGDHPSANKKRM
jgi:hypothetical protein